MPRACYGHAVPNLQVKNVSQDLHSRLRRCAKRRGRTVRDLVLDAVKRELLLEEFVERLERRSPVNLGRSAARSLDEARAERERDL